MRTKTFRKKAEQMAAALPIARSGFDLVGVRRVPTIQVPKSERFARAVQIFSVIAFPHMERSRLPSEIPGGGLQANGAPSRPPLCEAYAHRLRSPCPSALRRAHRGSGHTVQPRTAGALHRSRVRFEVAEHRGARWKEYSRFMRMAPDFPRSPPPVSDVADDSLSALIHRDVLHASPRLLGSTGPFLPEIAARFSAGPGMAPVKPFRMPWTP
jgi:hypothetical protein